MSGGDSDDLWAEFDQLETDRAPAASAPAQPQSRTVLILPGLREDGVAKVCSLLGISGYLLPQPGCLLLVPDPPVNLAVVRQLSVALRRVQLLRVDLKDSYLRIEVWFKGEVTDTPNAGIVAQQLPDPVLGLVHGSTDIAVVPGAHRIDEPGEGGGFFSKLLGR